MVKLSRALCCAALLASCAAAQTYYSYVGNLSSDSVLLAWGTADGVNTIGRSAPSRGEATVRIDHRTLLSRQPWIVIGNLKPDTEYPFEISLAGKVIGQGSVRTWPATSSKLVFFAMGDWGNGSEDQYAVARAMVSEFERRKNSGNPVRFVMSLGDSVYGDLSNILFGFRHTGREDVDWAGKFFEPYKPLLAHIPFYPVLGNHDGNETESRGDLFTFLDNFFFPGDKPARYYRFNYAGLVDFFALDSTRNTESGPLRSAYAENGEQFQWIKSQMPGATAPWKIPYFHHPPFNAGPRHAASYRDLEHWVRLFQSSGVKVVFSGHEHNFQYSEVNDQSSGIRFVVSGAGGELRAGDVRGRMRASNIAGWAPQFHFLVVEIDGKTMRITPVGPREVSVRNADGGAVTMPLVVTLP